MERKERVKISTMTKIFGRIIKSKMIKKKPTFPRRFRFYRSTPK